MPIFGAAFAAPNKGTAILYWFRFRLYWFRFLSTVLSPTENRRIQGLFKEFEWFSSTFKADLVFKDFSRKPSKFEVLFKPVRTQSLRLCLYMYLLLCFWHLKEFILKALIWTKVVCCYVLDNLFNSVYRSSLIWVHIVCPYTYIRQIMLKNMQQTISADSIFRFIFCQCFKG